jgi:hypothetical protein
LKSAIRMYVIFININILSIITIFCHRRMAHGSLLPAYFPPLISIFFLRPWGPTPSLDVDFGFSCAADSSSQTGWLMQASLQNSFSPTHLSVVCWCSWNYFMRLVIRIIYKRWISSSLFYSYFLVRIDRVSVLIASLNMNYIINQSPALKTGFSIFRALLCIL